MGKPDTNTSDKPKTSYRDVNDDCSDMLDLTNSWTFFSKTNCKVRSDGTIIRQFSDYGWYFSTNSLRLLWETLGGFRRENRTSIIPLLDELIKNNSN